MVENGRLVFLVWRGVLCCVFRPRFRLMNTRVVFFSVCEVHVKREELMFEEREARRCFPRTSE